ncbi:MAG: DUF389 domain-containing protein [Patescibacteria group bacterium]
MFKTFFVASFLEQKKTLIQLLHESQARADFHFLLAIATFIATLGLITDNAGITIGGILITPILFPLLSLAMGVVTSSPLAIGRALKIIFRSMVLVYIVSLATAFLFSSNVAGDEILLRIRPDLIMFLISLASGLAVAYAWVKQDLSATLPGVAVSVSLLPPLCAVGIGTVMMNRVVVAGGLTLFLIDLLAIVIGAIIAFALFGFSRLQKEEEEKIVEEQMEEKVQAKARK